MTFPASLTDSGGVRVKKSSALKVKVKTKTCFDSVASFLQNEFLPFPFPPLLVRDKYWNSQKTDKFAAIPDQPHLVEAIHISISFIHYP